MSLLVVERKLILQVVHLNFFDDFLWKIRFWWKLYAANKLFRQRFIHFVRPDCYQSGGQAVTSLVARLSPIWWPGYPICFTCHARPKFESGQEFCCRACPKIVPFCCWNVTQCRPEKIEMKHKLWRLLKEVSDADCCSRGKQQSWALENFGGCILENAVFFLK